MIFLIYYYFSTISIYIEIERDRRQRTSLISIKPNKDGDIH